MEKTDTSDGRSLPRLQYSAELGSLETFLVEKFSDRDSCTAYRTVQEVPPNIDDQTPRDLRDNNLGRRVAITEEIIAGKSDSGKLHLAGKVGLSVNDSLEAAINSCLSTFNIKKENGADRTELMNYCETRGRFVVKLIVENDRAIMTDFINHHANLFLYQGVNLEDIIDKSFRPVKIPYPDI